MHSASEFKRTTVLSIFIMLMAPLCLCQIEEIPFHSLLYDPFTDNAQNYEAKACDCYVAKNAAETKIYMTEFCRIGTDVGIMRSEKDSIEEDANFKYQKSMSVPKNHKVVITTDSLLAELTGAWDLKVRDLTTDTELYQVKIKKPADLSSYEFTSTDKYFVIFYQTNSENTISEHILPIYKTNGTKLWSKGMRYIKPFDRTNGPGKVDMVDAKMVIDYPGNRFFMAWEWSVNGGVSIKRRLIGPKLSDNGTEESVESLSTVNFIRLEGLGIVNGNEFVIYTTIESNKKVIKMWRKNLNSNPWLVASSFINTIPSRPFYKGAYVVTTLGGGKIVLVFSQKTEGRVARVMYKLFNDDGSSATTSGNPIVISQDDIEVRGVVLADWTLFMSMGPVSGVWYLGELNFAHG